MMDGATIWYIVSTSNAANLTERLRQLIHVVANNSRHTAVCDDISSPVLGLELHARWANRRGSVCTHVVSDGHAAQSAIEMIHRRHCGSPCTLIVFGDPTPDARSFLERMYNVRGLLVSRRLHVGNNPLTGYERVCEKDVLVLPPLPISLTTQNTRLCVLHARLRRATETIATDTSFHECIDRLRNNITLANTANSRPSTNSPIVWNYAPREQTWWPCRLDFECNNSDYIIVKDLFTNFVRVSQKYFCRLAGPYRSPCVLSDEPLSLAIYRDKPQTPRRRLDWHLACCEVDEFHQDICDECAPEYQMLGNHGTIPRILREWSSNGHMCSDAMERACEPLVNTTTILTGTDTHGLSFYQLFHVYMSYTRIHKLCPGQEITIFADEQVSHINISRVDPSLRRIHSSHRWWDSGVVRLTNGVVVDMANALFLNT